MIFPARIQVEIILIGFTGLLPYIASGMKVFDNHIRCKTIELCDCSEGIYYFKLFSLVIGIWFSALCMGMTILSLFFMCDVDFDKRMTHELQLTDRALAVSLIGTGINNEDSFGSDEEEKEPDS